MKIHRTYRYELDLNVEQRVLLAKHTVPPALPSNGALPGGRRFTRLKGKAQTQWRSIEN
ncbi:MAG: hypothetical protein RBR24_01135 [Candidatus Carbobacillus sp.]|nr:hypothetical protein [Candidatus Carbobacillus sp.]